MANSLVVVNATIEWSIARVVAAEDADPAFTDDTAITIVVVSLALQGLALVAASHAFLHLPAIASCRQSYVTRSTIALVARTLTRVAAGPRYPADLAAAPT